MSSGRKYVVYEEGRRQKAVLNFVATAILSELSEHHVYKHYYCVCLDINKHQNLSLKRKKRFYNLRITCNYVLFVIIFVSVI